MFGREELKEKWCDGLACDTLIYDAIKYNKKFEANIKELKVKISKKD